MAQTYEVKSGDSLNAIAKQYGYSDYKSAGISGFGNNPDLITPGMKLTISGTPLQSNVSSSSGDSRSNFNRNSADLTNILAKYYPQNQQPGNVNTNTPGGENMNTGGGTTVNPATPGANNQNATIDNYSDPYTQALDKMKANQDAATQNLIATIQAKRANRGNEINQSYQRYKEGLMLLGIQSEDINSTPDIVMGNIQQAENARIAKLQDLDMQEATALLEAQTARDEKDFKLLKDRMDYIKEIKRERINTLKDNFDMLKAEQGIADIQAEQIYDQLGKLSGNQKEQFLQEIANSFNVPVGAIVAGVAKVAKARKTGTGGGGGKLTAGEKKSGAWSQLNSLMSSNVKTKSGAPIVDANGYITPEGFKAMVMFGQENDISKKDLFEAYSQYLYLDNYKDYGLTPVEYKSLTGTLPQGEVL